MDRASASESEGSVHLQIVQLNDRLEETRSAGPTIFAPQSSIETKNNSNSVSWKRSAVRAPEKQLIIFALRLAVLEKAATGLGTLGFIWATVVLLGGFAITLKKTDFWFITVILLIEGTRIFSRSHELKWQNQVTCSITDAGVNSFRAIRSSSHIVIKAAKAIFRPITAAGKTSRHSREVRESTYRGEARHWDQTKASTRTWATSDVPLLPYAEWSFISRNVSKLLYWLQLASATACVVLSLMKLTRHDYGEVAEGDTDKRNRKSALNIFYALALAEALLFLLEKAYWEWKVSICKLLDEVKEECQLGPHGMILIRRFFYDAYSRCVNGSIFDGLKMDMVSFAIELLQSNSSNEQLIGATILRKFATTGRFSDDTLQKIGINLSVMERLVEMLNWKDPKEEEIRLSAAEIISRLAGKRHNCLRVSGIPGAMESISSLLHIHRNSSGATDEIFEKKIIFDSKDYGFCTFNNLGLLILRKLARDHENCGKIGNTRGLLPKVIDFTQAGEKLLKYESVAPSQILTVKRSLQLVKMLASTTGATGHQLRKEISEVVFTLSNIRDILSYGGKQPALQKLGIEILTSLAIEEDATERIGGTGGVLKELLKIFFKQGLPENQYYLRIAAGEALAMLALESKNNCHRILRLKVTEKLIEALEIPLIRVNAARILRNLCTYSGPNCFQQLRIIIAAGPTMLKAIMKEENKLQEVMIGLAVHVFKFMTPEESGITFEKARIQEVHLARALVQILKKYRCPPVQVPRIRRFVIELAIWMMKDKEKNIQDFRDLGMMEELDCVTDTMSELESFNIFSGTVGLSRHSTNLDSLVEIAMDLLGANN